MGERGGEKLGTPDVRGCCDEYLANVGVLCTREGSFAGQCVGIYSAGRLTDVHKIAHARIFMTALFVKTNIGDYLNI